MSLRLFFLILGACLVSTMEEGIPKKLPRGWARQYISKVEFTEQQQARMDNSVKLRPQTQMLRGLEQLNLHKEKKQNMAIIEDEGNVLTKKRGSSRRKRQIALQCGFINASIVCDDPEIRGWYARAAGRYTVDVETPVVEYKLITVAEDDHSKPSVTMEQALAQNEVLNKAYFDFTTKDTARLHFNYTMDSINRDYLRYRYLIPGDCNKRHVTNTELDPQCMTEVTGFDGGQLMCALDDTDCNKECKSYWDILRRSDCTCICREEFYKCKPEMIANRFCNKECNWKQYNWDGGDCCPDPDNLNSVIRKDFGCRDPANQLANWQGMDDFFFLIDPPARPSTDPAVKGKFAIYGVPMAPDILEKGVAVPFSSSNFGTAQSGIFVDSERAFGVNQETGSQGKALIRLVGEIFGLLPVDAGVTGLLANQTTPLTKQDVCNSPCYESQDRGPQANTTGDLIDDTAPMPRIFNTLQNGTCITEIGECGAPGTDSFCTDCVLNGNGFKNSPLSNYMGFGDDQCQTTFSLQQVGRLLCYLDNQFRPWMTEGNRGPGPILRPPIAVASNVTGSLTVTWEPPFQTGTSSQLDYLLEREPAYKPEIFKVNGPETKFNDRTLEPKTLYRYRVRAITPFGAGIVSPWSNMAGGLLRTCRCRDWNLDETRAIDHVRGDGCGKKK